MDGLVAELLEGARAEMAVVAEHGGAVEAVDYMKAALVESHRERHRAGSRPASRSSSASTATPRPSPRR